MERVKEKGGSYSELYLYDKDGNETDDKDNAAYGYLRVFDSNGNYIMEHILHGKI